MEFYKLSYGFRDIKVIAANNKYEAFGYYLLHCHNGCGCADDIVFEVMSPDEKIEVECIGIPKYKTLAEIYREKDVWDISLPSVVIGLID